MSGYRHDWRQLRVSRGWSQGELLRRLDAAARKAGVGLPGREALKRALSRWENGRCVPSQFYLVLLREVHGLQGLPGVAPSQLAAVLDELSALSVRIRILSEWITGLDAGVDVRAVAA